MSKLKAKTGSLVGLHALRTVQKYHPFVEKIVDARKAVDISVSTSDCQVGTKRAPSACALAKAALRDYDGAVIARSIAYLVKGKKAVRYKIPYNARSQINSFDANQHFAPGEYTLLAPRNSQKMGYHQASRPFLSSGKKYAKRQKVKTHVYAEKLRAL